MEKMIKVKQKPGPSIRANPFPNYAESRMNAIIEGKYYYAKRSIREVKTQKGKV